MPHAFASLREESDYCVDDIEGRLPADLIGTLYRSGPAQWETGTRRAPLQHLFDGDGMLSEFTLTGRRLHFRNRYVRTPQYQAGLREPGITLRGLGTQRPGGAATNALRGPANTASGGVVMHADRLLMLSLTGRPYELDPDTLQTLGEQDFHGLLPRRGFSSHAKQDPQSGELYNFGMGMFPWPALRCYRLDSWGRLSEFRRIRLPQPLLNHDFALTPRYLVFVLDPLVPDMQGIALGRSPIDRLLQFRPQLGTRLLLVPRDGGPVREIEHEALMHLHINNAWEEGPDTVIELLRHEGGWAPLAAGLRDFRNAHSALPSGRLWRYRIGADGRARGEPCGEHAGELPQHDSRRSGNITDFSYYAAQLPGDRAAVVKVDHARHRSLVHELPRGHLVGEPVFVPRQVRADEDDGWLLALAYDPGCHRSRLLILDARDPSRPSLAQAWLRQHLPPGMHGCFTPRIARRLPGE